MLFFDFYYFYAVGLLTHNNLDPYVIENYRAALFSLGYPSEKFVAPFPYPVWSLWFFYILGLFNYNISLALFSILNIVILLYSSSYLFNTIKYKTEWLTKYKFTVLYFTYLPVVKTIFFAQLSIVIFGGLLLVSYLYEKKKYFFSGILSSFLFIKPHLLIASLVYLFCKSIKYKTYHYSLGLIIGIILQLCFVKQIFDFEVTHFYKFLHMTPHEELDQNFEILSASIVNLLTNLFNLQSLKYLAISISTIIGFSFAMKSNSIHHTILYILTPISLCLSPYAWSHDYILIFPIVFRTIIDLLNKFDEKIILICWIILNILLSMLLMLNYESLFFLLFLIVLFSFRKECLARH